MTGVFCQDYQGKWRSGDLNLDLGPMSYIDIVFTPCKPEKKEGKVFLLDSRSFSNLEKVFTASKPRGKNGISTYVLSTMSNRKC